MENFTIAGMKGIYYKGVRIVNNNKAYYHIKWVKEAIDRLPEIVLEAIIDKKVLFRIDGSNGCEYLKENQDVAGFFVGPNIIYLREELSRFSRKEDFIQVVLHEIGHFIDTYNEYGEEQYEEICLIEIFEGDYIYDKYGNYFKKNLAEFFAQSFYAYVSRSREFFDYCPKMVQFINDSIVNI